MAFNDHQVQHNRGHLQKKAGIMELRTNEAILEQNKLLSQQVEDLTKKMSKLPQQLKEMHEISNKHQHASYCELYNEDHPTGYCPLAHKR